MILYKSSEFHRNSHHWHLRCIANHTHEQPWRDWWVVMISSNNLTNVVRTEFRSN
jgi:hypothetical protein